mmetsp:Transcript_17437/g.26677  ORF Transcript_17437/g.26677 Transcript_17437/m.26677 type:complete len:110 (+) Transcript_17437:1325-1654(+)
MIEIKSEKNLWKQGNAIVTPQNRLFPNLNATFSNEKSRRLQLIGCCTMYQPLFLAKVSTSWTTLDSPISLPIDRVPWEKLTQDLEPNENDGQNMFQSSGKGKSSEFQSS